MSWLIVRAMHFMFGGFVRRGDRSVGVTQLPAGTIDTRQKFLPQFGATWDITS